MKQYKAPLIYATAFALLLGLVLVLPTLAPKPVEANVNFDPDTMDLGAPGWTVKEVTVSVWFKTGKYKPDDVDPKTVLVEGVLEPKGGWKGTWIEKLKIEGHTVFALRFKLAGGDLMDLLKSIISHMGLPGPSADIPLLVTGNLYDGVPFEGTGYMYTMWPTNPPPNPPPTPP